MQILLIQIKHIATAHHVTVADFQGNITINFEHQIQKSHL